MAQKLTEEQILDNLKEKFPEYDIKNIRREMRSGKNEIIVQYVCKNDHFNESYYWNMMKGHGCFECHKMKGVPSRRKYTKEFIDDFCKNNNIEILDEFRNTSTPIAYKCLKCGNVSVSDFRHLVNGRKCRVCSGYVVTDKEFKKEVKKIVGDEYTFIEEYNKSSIPIEVRHNKCNNTYKVSPNNFKRGKRCPFCFNSKGEEKVKEFLEENNIKFRKQYGFDDCKNKNKLFFDFAVFKENEELYCLIEYDGEFHYKEIERFNNDLESQKRRDAIKNNYCETNNIKLIRIPYWEFDNIEHILSNELF